MAQGIQDNFRPRDCPEKLGVEDVEMAPAELYRRAADYGTGYSGQFSSKRLS